MKWQKLCLFLAGSGAALSCVALLGLLLTDLPWLHGLWQALIAYLWYWFTLSHFTNGLTPATWWTVCAVAVIDMLYLLWSYRQRRGRAYHFVDGAPLSSCRYRSATTYETRLRQRRAALLARYQDPTLVQFLLNREAARTQRLEHWFAAGESRAPMTTSAPPTPLLTGEREGQHQAEHPPLVMLVNPLGA